MFRLDNYLQEENYVEHIDASIAQKEEKLRMDELRFILSQCLNINEVDKVIPRVRADNRVLNDIGISTQYKESKGKISEIIFKNSYASSLTLDERLRPRYSKKTQEIVCRIDKLAPVDLMTIQLILLYNILSSIRARIVDTTAYEHQLIFVPECCMKEWGEYARILLYLYRWTEKNKVDINPQIVAQIEQLYNEAGAHFTLTFNESHNENVLNIQYNMIPFTFESIDKLGKLISDSSKHTNLELKINISTEMRYASFIDEMRSKYMNLYQQIKDKISHFFQYTANIFTRLYSRIRGREYQDPHRIDQDSNSSTSINLLEYSKTNVD